MEVNKLESREVLFMIFGLPVMMTAIVLASIAVGHWVTVRSDRPTNVTVSAATPKIDVNVPTGPAPLVQVAAAAPKIDVNVPQAIPPTINVTPPAAVVTVVDRHSEPAKPSTSVAPEVKTAPASAPAIPAVKSPVEPAKTSTLLNPERLASNVRDEDLTLETLYRYAEKYIDSYCKKNSLDPAAEAQNWNKKWKLGLDQAMADNTDTSEQSYINRIAISKRECFDIEKATPEKVVEGCRIMLRYRDGKLALLKAMADAATNENMKKTLVFLAAGVH